MSKALMKQPTPSKRVQPVNPCRTLSPMTIAPLVFTRVASGAAGVDQRISPLRALSATIWALLAGSRILSSAMAMLRIPPYPGA